MRTKAWAAAVRVVTGGDGFGGDVDHADFAASGVVREFWHFDLGGDFFAP